jgi:exosome complex component MTR3
MKLTCTVHGPRALPRSAPFSPHLVVSTHVKFAPFATRQRRGYLRDMSERDLAVHLETAIRGAIIADRWPKSGVDIIVTVIEGDQEREASRASGDEEWDLMNVLSACITVASAAISDAGIDCLDVVAGGAAALVAPTAEAKGADIVLDPVSAESSILAACCVAYLPERDEIAGLWLKGQLPPSDSSLLHTRLLSKAVQAARGAVHPLTSSLAQTLQHNEITAT